ncbi:uncharacterized protein [Narcine bancroftii]|uniref:uncharacterized protein n=1 Tax=Narcine bancroftii TaxID=1343680 RepID=UPI0038311C97
MRQHNRLPIGEVGEVGFRKRGWHISPSDVLHSGSTPGSLLFLTPELPRDLSRNVLESRWDLPFSTLRNYARTYRLRFSGITPGSAITLELSQNLPSSFHREKLRDLQILWNRPGICHHSQIAPGFAIFITLGLPQDLQSLLDHPGIWCFYHSGIICRCHSWITLGSFLPITATCCPNTLEPLLGSALTINLGAVQHVLSLSLWDLLYITPISAVAITSGLRSSSFLWDPRVISAFIKLSSLQRR